MNTAKQIREPRANYLALEEPALLRGFELLATADGGVAKLRELILSLAVQGKLVPQSTKDEPASAILAKIRKEKAAIATPGRRKANASVPVNHGADSITVPAGWCASSLAEIGIISPRNITDDDTLASFVQMSSIPAGLMETHTTEQRRWGEIKSGFTHFAEDDVGLAKITPCFENGKSTIFRNLENGIGAGTTELHIVRPLGNVLPEYILVFLKSPAFLKNGEAGMTGSAGQKRLPRAYFESTPFPLPPLAEQHRIVARVEELMTLCDELEDRGRLADEQHARLTTTLFDALTASDSAQTLADNWHRIATHFDLLLDRPQAIDALEQTILQLAVRGLLVPQDANDEPADKLLHRLWNKRPKDFTKHTLPTAVDAAPYRLPDTWAWNALDDLVEGMGSGWSPACDEGRRIDDDRWAVLRTTAVQVMEYRPGEHKTLPSKLEPRPNIEVNRGDILITRAGPTNRVGISCAVERTPHRLMLSDKIVRFHPVDEAILPAFIVLALNAGWTKAQLEQAKTGMAASQVNISQTQLKNVLIPVCCSSEQHRIVARVEQLRRLCADLRERLNKVRATQTHLAEALVTEAVQPQRGVRLG